MAKTEEFIVVGADTAMGRTAYGARTTAGLTHREIAAIYGIAEYHGDWFMIIEAEDANAACRKAEQTE